MELAKRRCAGSMLLLVKVIHHDPVGEMIAWHGWHHCDISYWFRRCFSVPKSIVWLFCGNYREGGKHDFIICDESYQYKSLLLWNPWEGKSILGDVFCLREQPQGMILLVRLLNSLSVIETQAGNVLIFIPTSVIVITDWQIIETDLCYQGICPAIVIAWLCLLSVQLLKSELCSKHHEATVCFCWCCPSTTLFYWKFPPPPFLPLPSPPSIPSLSSPTF